MTPARRGGARRRVAIVDDHALLAASLAMVLRQAGMEASIPPMTSVEECLAYLRGQAPLVVLLELDLGPLGHGEWMVAPLVEADATVVVLTGLDNRARLAACVGAGAVGVIRKTLDLPSVVRTIERALAGEALMPAGERYALLAEARARVQERHERMAVFASLTPREQDVLRELVMGRAVDIIAAERVVAASTIRTQVRGILTKLGVNSQLEAVARARAAGWPEEALDGGSANGYSATGGPGQE